MARTTEQKIQERYDRINKLKGEIETRQAELLNLMGLEDKTKQIKPLPEGVNLMDVIMDVFKESPVKTMQIKEVVKAVDKKYPDCTERKTVQSTIQYLANTKKLLKKIEGYGKYMLVENQTS